MRDISSIVFSEPGFNDKPSAWMEHIPFAFFLVERLRPAIVVELGTQYGTSYFAFCQAIRQLNLHSRAFAVDVWLNYDETHLSGLETFEYALKINNENFAHFSNLLRMTFDDALGYFEDGSIDLLHIDGMHDYTSVKHDFETWLPKMSAGGVILFHDSNVRESGFGVWKLISELKPRYPSFEFLHCNGLAVVCTGPEVNSEFLSFIHRAGYDPWYHSFFVAMGQRISNGFLKDMYSRDMNAFREEVKQLKQSRQELISEIERLRESAIQARNTCPDNQSPMDNPVPDIHTVTGALPTRESLADKLLNYLNYIRYRKRIKKSGWFNAAYYMGKYPDVAGMNPLKHYCLRGGFEGRNPCPGFDGAYYISQNPDVAQSNLNPLLHYLLFGIREQRKPKP
jgi:hypothetical protein